MSSTSLPPATAPLPGTHLPDRMIAAPPKEQQQKEKEEEQPLHPTSARLSAIAMMRTSRCTAARSYIIDFDIDIDIHIGDKREIIRMTDWGVEIR